MENLFCAPVCVEVRAKNDKKMQLLQQELDNIRKNEISEAEHHWNCHITSLTENHSKTLSDANEVVTPTKRDFHLTHSLMV